MQEVVVLTGPTASGKTGEALRLAPRCRAEIINADSVQVYRGFDIGSGKPGPDELRQAKHHLISCIDPAEHFDAGKFCALADACIRETAARGMLPLITGGTGLYIRALLCGLADTGEVTAEARQQVASREAQAGSEGAAKALYEWLLSIDRDSAALLNPADISRIRRALLIRLSSGQSISELQRLHQHAGNRYRALVIIMQPERPVLYQAINDRVDRMIADGLIEEVKNLRQHYPLNSHPFGAIGYRHAGLFLDGRITLDRMVELLKRDTRRFAKRQMTWWRNQPASIGWCTLAPVASNGEEPRSSEQISEKLLGIIASFLGRRSEFCQSPVTVAPFQFVQPRA